MFEKFPDAYFYWDTQLLPENLEMGREDIT